MTTRILDEDRPIKHVSRELKEMLFLEERQLAVAEMYFVKHMTQKEISLVLGVTQKTVSNDIKKIRNEYSMKRLNKMQQYLNVELAKLDAVEKQAWLAWERSIGTTKRVTKKQNSNGDWEEIVQTEELVGDPRFLTQVQAAIDRRIRLLGLDAPQEVLVNQMESRLTKAIQDQRVTFDMLVSDIGIHQARRYFNLAGVPIPNIIEGELVDDTSSYDNDDYVEDDYVEDEDYYLDGA